MTSDGGELLQNLYKNQAIGPWRSSETIFKKQCLRRLKYMFKKSSLLCLEEVLKKYLKIQATETFLTFGCRNGAQLHISFIIFNKIYWRSYNQKKKGSVY